jgi:cell division protein FtsI (penicillin-binding protein 3)
MNLSSISPRRFWMANGLIVCLFAVVLYQLFQLSIFRRPALLELADRQHLLRVEISPLRGEILDANGKELATNLKVPSIYAVPRLIPKAEKEKLSEKLAAILALDKKFILERISRDKAFVWLKRRTHYDEAEKIRALHSPALGIVKEYRRFYPQGDLLSHVLGFTNIDTHGIEGVELHMNKELQGRPGKRFTKRDALGREIRAYEMQQTPSIDGNKITLTIDQYLQYLTERALDKAYVKWKAKGATAVVMEAKTGRILALATRPTFDPNHVGKTVADVRRNRTITDMYEPGSVFKIVAASAVLNEGKATPETSFFCENGAYRYVSKVLHDVHSYGNLSFADVIVKSSNIGTVKAAALLKPETLQSYIEAFGFGKRTGVDLPGEAPGYTRPPSQWSKTSPYNIPMGQEIMVTALQMVAAMDVIANGGNLMQPYIIEKIEDQQGVVLKEKKPTLKRRVIREDVAAIMRGILTRVVEEGTGKGAMIKGIPVAGKTGTAQKVLPSGRGYSHSNFMASFVGFAPADEPEYVMGVVLDDPKPLYYGGTVSAPVFKEVMEVALLSKGYVPQHAETASLSPNVQTLPETRPKLVPAEGLAAKI